MDDLWRGTGYLGLIFLADMTWAAVQRSPRAGRLRVIVETPRLYSFRSNTGTFAISANARTLAFTRAGQRGALRFDEIMGLEYRVDERHALLEEILGGFGMTDFLERYRDTLEWHAIAVVTNDGRRIPLYVAGQYQPRDLLMSGYCAWQARLLRRLGVMQDVEGRSRELLRLLQERLGAPRLL